MYKNLSVVFSIVLSPFSFSLEQQGKFANNICPIVSLGEQEWDCPWALVVREFQQQNSSVDLKILLPEFVQQIKYDAHSEKELFWGKSLNFDENTKTSIVETSLLQNLETILETQIILQEQPSAETQVVKAGYEHTYGYLFSNLKTPYGYKRERWVSGEIERAFRLPEKVFGPMPNDDSTLFANVTYFAGHIAFREHPRTLQKLEKQTKHVSESLLNFDYANLNPTRVVETIMAPLKNGQIRQVQIITDYVPFLQKNSDIQNSVLLIYTIVDEFDNGPELISVFPISEQSFKSALNKNRFGENQLITTHNNAYVEGVTGNTLKGIRTLFAKSKTETVSDN